MGSPIVLGPKPLRLDPGSIVLLGIVAGLLITALRLILLAGGNGFTLIAALATAVLATGPAANLVLRRVRRSTVTPFERGLVFESRGWKRTILLHGLQSLELRERDVPGGLMRRIALEDGQGEVCFEHFASRKEQDRLGGFFVYLLSRLVEATEQKLKTGKTIAGWDWILGPDGLAAPADDHPLPLAEIGAVTVRQGRVAIWRCRERFPFFVFPADSPNAVVLVALLSRRLEERDELF